VSTVNPNTKLVNSSNPGKISEKIMCWRSQNKIKKQRFYVQVKAWYFFYPLKSCDCGCE
jgi:hypothetical protein